MALFFFTLTREIMCCLLFLTVQAHLRDSLKNHNLLVLRHHGGTF